MFKHLQKMKGQSTLEYAILIVIIIGALLTIQGYLKRGVQGRLKSSADDIGDQFAPGNTNQIKSTRTTVQTNELSGYTATGAFAQGVSSSTQLGAGKLTNVTENTQIVNSELDYWGK